MHEKLLAKRYAKAAFDLAVEMNIMEQVKTDMILVLDTCNKSKDLRLLLKSPVIHTAKKLLIINKIFEDHVEKLTTKFLDLIIKQKREAYIMEIARQFIELYKEYKNITTTYLRTPVKISDDIRKKVISLMEEHTQGEIELITEIDEDLIGGFVLDFDDKQFDASLQSRINKLRKEFEVNYYLRDY